MQARQRRIERQFGDRLGKGVPSQWRTGGGQSNKALPTGRIRARLSLRSRMMCMPDAGEGGLGVEKKLAGQRAGELH